MKQRRFVRLAALTAVIAGATSVLTGLSTAVPAAAAGTSPSAVEPAAALPVCQHFSDVVPPVRSVTPGHGPAEEIPPVDVSGRLPAPGNVTGGLSNGQVSFTFDRVPGARAYRAFRNGQALAWISDWGQPELRVTDTTPCENANYQIYAMTDESGTDHAIGQISTSYRVGADGTLAPFQIPAGTTRTVMVTAYNDGGPTASGIDAGAGFCAVDVRFIPWGTRFYVPGYGYCFAADIGLWIQGDIVDIWLPGFEANDWGVQERTIIFQ